MLSWRKYYYILLNFYINFLVRSKIIPTDFFDKIDIDSHKPIVYVLPYDSQIDLLTLRQQCSKHGLSDPLIPINIDGIILKRYIFIHERAHFLKKYEQKSDLVELLHHYLNLHISHPELDVQMVPVLVMFGRSPGKGLRFNQDKPHFHRLNGIKKFIELLWFGRDNFIHFSTPCSMRHIATEHGINKAIVQKLIRLTRIHFFRQKLVIAGPRLPIHQDLLKTLLVSKTIEHAVKDEARSKKISLEKAQKNAIEIIEEIAANFSYEVIRLSDRVLGWIWHWLYQGVYVCNIDRVHKLAERGYEIVYVPCHRSHMDYLILSYVLYHQGLVPPHIAAGINLSFWPVGSFFRRLGAFFIRRTFKGNKLYSTIFREYLVELFTLGSSVEYFIEGSRSRTGLLLEPKTGILTMTIQAMLRSSNRRPITLVPVYIGYEHVLEVASYTKELHGAKKEKDGLWKTVRSLCKLCNLGQGYINFGDPLPLVPWLSQRIPQWRNSIDQSESQRPSWLVPAVNKIATTMMIRINNAAAANAINLCANILLASRSHALLRQEVLSQLICYLKLLRNVPYAPEVTVPNMTPEALLEHALIMKKFTIKQHPLGEIILLSCDQAVLMTYYRNNIYHLLIIPALIACIIVNHFGIQREQLYQKIKLLHPFLKSELFMRFSTEELPSVIDNFVIELECQGLLILQGTQLYAVQSKSNTLTLLADSIRGILQRYAIVFSLLQTSSCLFHREILEQKSRMITQQLSILHDRNVPEFFDKKIFSSLVATLRSEQYTNDIGNINNDKIKEILDILSALIYPDVFYIIQRATLLIKVNTDKNIII